MKERNIQRWKRETCFQHPKPTNYTTCTPLTLVSSVFPFQCAASITIDRKTYTRPSCFETLNPFVAPEPLPIQNPSNFVPRNGFPVVKGLTWPDEELYTSPENRCGKLRQLLPDERFHGPGIQIINLPKKKRVFDIRTIPPPDTGKNKPQELTTLPRIFIHTSCVNWNLICIRKPALSIAGACPPVHAAATARAVLSLPVVSLVSRLYTISWIVYRGDRGWSAHAARTLLERISNTSIMINHTYILGTVRTSCIHSDQSAGSPGRRCMSAVGWWSLTWLDQSFQRGNPKKTGNNIKSNQSNTPSGRFSSTTTKHVSYAQYELLPGRARPKRRAGGLQIKPYTPPLHAG